MSKGKRTIRYYHMIIEPIGGGDESPNNRKEYISTKRDSAPDGWKCVAICGFHDEVTKNAYPNLYAELARNGISQKELANRIKISECALNRKMKGHNPFFLWEAKAIAAELPSCSVEYLFKQED